MRILALVGSMRLATFNSGTGATPPVGPGARQCEAGPRRNQLHADTQQHSSHMWVTPQPTCTAQGTSPPATQSHSPTTTKAVATASLRHTPTHADRQPPAGGGLAVADGPCCQPPLVEAQPPASTLMLRNSRGVWQQQLAAAAVTSWRQPEQLSSCTIAQQQGTFRAPPYPPLPYIKGALHGVCRVIDVVSYP